MSTKITEAFKDEFNIALADLKKATANAQLQGLLKCLRKHNLLYVVERINAEFTLTHKANRGGLLLSPHNVHRNGSRIYQCGADLKQLTNALCMELAASGRVREEHLTKNALLIGRAAGLLAPINGSERYVTLGCGHTAAFCKHAALSGRTSEKILQCADSNNIDLQKLCANSNFKTMIMEGWSWEVVPAIIDELYPAFASIAQKALNTQNHISSDVGELETCMILAASVDDPGMMELPNWKELAVTNVVSLCVPCSKYSNTLLDFVVTFGGGKGAPFIAFMDSVAKQFGCTVNLGQSFWDAIAHTTFPSKTCMFPLFRIALALTNMTSDKMEDNTARLISKGDVTRVASRPQLPAVVKAEAALQQAIDIATPLGGVDVVLKPLGQMFVRVGLMITGKDKHGRERTVYSLKEIRNKFLEDASEIVGKKILFSEWNPTESIEDAKTTKPELAASTGAAPAAPKAAVVSLSDHMNPVWIAGQSGFAVGQLVVQKSVEASPERLYTIFDLGETVQLHQVCSYIGDPLKVSIPLEDLMCQWTLTKTEPAVQMKGGQARPAKALETDKQKSTLFRALMDLDAKHVHKHELTFWRKPNEVRTTCNIKEGHLILVPMAPLVYISTKNTVSMSGISLGQHEVAGQMVEFFVLPLPKPQQAQRFGESLADEFQHGALVAAFWWVSTTTDKKLANMVLSSVCQNGVEVPVLKNTVDLSQHSKLYMCVKPKAKVEPIHSTIERRAAKAPAPKKPRRS